VSLEQVEQTQGSLDLGWLSLFFGFARVCSLKWGQQAQSDDPEQDIF
jgi:hypothetical protein